MKYFNRPAAGRNQTPASHRDLTELFAVRCVFNVALISARASSSPYNADRSAMGAVEDRPRRWREGHEHDASFSSQMTTLTERLFAVGNSNVETQDGRHLPRQLKCFSLERGAERSKPLGSRTRLFDFRSFKRASLRFPAANHAT